MHRVRVLLTLAAVVSTAPAWAQPVDPYRTPAPAAPLPPAAPARPDAAPAPASPSSEAPQDPYATSSAGSASDPMMAERVAHALATRAQELLDGRMFLDAKQLAVEALVANPRGSSAARARAIIHAVNVQLGIPEEAAKPEPIQPTEDVDTSPIQDPTLSAPPVLAPPEGGRPSGRVATRVHGGLYAGLLGSTIGAFLSQDTPAAGAVPLGLAMGAAGALALPLAVDQLKLTEAEVRTVGAATMWGGVVGGLLGDTAKVNDTSAREVLVAASAGATLAGLGGYALTRSTKLTRGDVALIDTFAGIGGLGGFTLGMVMQPVESEAYSLNAVIGIASGVVVGYVAAPQTNTTPRRMLRVAGWSALGGAVPFLLYAAIRSSSSSADERITGALASGGLVAGAYLGFRLTDGMDDGLDTLDGKRSGPEVHDAPVALIGRTSAGRWGLGGLAIAPLSPTLAPQHGMTIALVGAAF
jgi:hypothetical protein